MHSNLMATSSPVEMLVPEKLQISTKKTSSLIARDKRPRAMFQWIRRKSVFSACGVRTRRDARTHTDTHTGGVRTITYLGKCLRKSRSQSCARGDTCCRHAVPSWHELPRWRRAGWRRNDKMRREHEVQCTTHGRPYYNQPALARACRCVWVCDCVRSPYVCHHRSAILQDALRR